MSIHKKIDSFNNLNQKVINLNILQDFLGTISENSPVDEKINKNSYTKRKQFQDKL